MVSLGAIFLIFVTSRTAPTEMPGNIIDVCNVTPGTVLTIPLYTEVNTETNSVSYVIKIITNETEYLTNISNYGTFESLFLTFENGFISGGLSLRGA